MIKIQADIGVGKLVTLVKFHQLSSWHEEKVLKIHWKAFGVGPLFDDIFLTLDNLEIAINNENKIYWKLYS